MGEGTDRLDVIPGNDHQRADTPPPRETAKDLGGEIVAVRQELDVLVAELDRRRHEALDLGLQVRRHAPGVALTAVAFIGAAAGFVWLGMWRARRRRRLAARADRLRFALSRMIERPERVASEPTMTARIVTAAVNAALAGLIKKTLERVLADAMAPRRSTADTTRAPGRGRHRSDAPHAELMSDGQRRIA